MERTTDPSRRDEDAPAAERAADLASRIARKDRQAFAALVLAHQRSVRCFIGGYIRDRATVDDLAQEVFLAAYRKIGDFRGDSTLGSWLLGIARKQVLLYLRTHARKDARRLGTLAAEIEGWRLDELQEAAAVNDRMRDLALLEGCLEKLAPTSAAVVTKYYFGGLRIADIARSLGRQESAIKVMLFRTRQALKRCLDEARVATPGGGLP